MPTTPLSQVLTALSGHAYNNRNLPEAKRSAYYTALSYMAKWMERMPTGLAVRLKRDGKTIEAAEYHVPRVGGKDAILVNRPQFSSVQKLEDLAARVDRTILITDQARFHGPRDPNAGPTYIAWREYSPARFISKYWYLTRSVRAPAENDIPLFQYRTRIFQLLEDIAIAAGMSRKDAFISDLATYVGENWATFSGNLTDFTPVVRHGSEAYDVYKRSDGRTYSCMIGKPMAEFYGINPPEPHDAFEAGADFDPFDDDPAHDGCAVFTFNRNDALIARCIVWFGRTFDKNQEFTGRRVMLDRIYPSDNGPHTRAMREYAVEQGWLYKNVDSASDSSIVDGALVKAKMDKGETVDVKAPGGECYFRGDIRIMARGSKAGWPYFDTLFYVAVDDEVARKNAHGRDVPEGEVRLLKPTDSSYYQSRHNDGGLGAAVLRKICDVGKHMGSDINRYEVYNKKGEVSPRMLCAKHAEEADFVHGYVRSKIGTRDYDTSGYFTKADGVQLDGGIYALERATFTDPKGRRYLRSSGVILSESVYGEGAIGLKTDAVSVRYDDRTRVVLSDDVTTLRLPLNFVKEMGYVGGLDPFFPKNGAVSIKVLTKDVEDIKAARAKWEASGTAEVNVVIKKDQLRWEF